MDVDEVAKFAETLPDVAVSRNYSYMCSDPGQALIIDDIRKHDLNRVVVASCSPRMHEPTFRKTLMAGGLNPYFLEMANIREQCSWVHQDPIAATEKAKRIVESAVVKSRRLEPLDAKEVDVEPVLPDHRGGHRRHPGRPGHRRRGLQGLPGGEGRRPWAGT